MPKMNKWELESSDIVRRRMGKTGEELAELLSVVSRIQIQGIASTDPGSGKLNYERLQDEVADVYAQLDETVLRLKMDSEYIEARRAHKRSLMIEWENIYVSGHEKNAA